MPPKRMTCPSSSGVTGIVSQVGFELRMVVVQGLVNGWIDIAAGIGKLPS